MDDPALWIAFRDVPGLNRVAARVLVEAFGHPEAIFRRTFSELNAICGEDPASAIARGPRLGPARAELARTRALGLSVLPQGDPAFPPRLLEISDPPLLLYVLGRLPDLPTVSIVGSRRATPRGREAARGFAAALARAGCAVVSGLAYGIDAEAHRGALAVGGRTIAILASGLDRPGPRGNLRLAREILERDGAWISEHPPGTEARARHFPDRNRLISGMSRATLVVEARERSGSLRTAAHAGDQSRDVLVIPGPIDSDAYRGSNRLLAEGAKIVLDPLDAVKLATRLDVEAGAVPRVPPRRSEELPLPAGEAGAIVRRVRAEPRGADDLVEALGLGPSRLAALLFELELEGWITRQGRRIAAGPKAGKN